MPVDKLFAESPESVGIDPAKLEALFARAAQEVEQGVLPSAQIALARNGRIAGMRTVGAVTANGRPVPATNATLYCVFSATKALISSAAWLLIQEGRLGLDERPADAIPEFATNGKQVVTVEQLFTHTAGFPNAPYPQGEWGSRDKRLERFARWRLEWEPGSRFIYHPTATMWVIAELIERRTGMDYRDFVRERIALPLGLDDLRVGLPAEHDARMADIVHVGEMLTPEQLTALGLPVLPLTEVTEDALAGFNSRAVRAAGAPGGGGVMTAGDLAIFYQALLTGRAHDGSEIWKPETLRLAREIRSGELTDPVFGKRANRALGLIVAGDADRNFRGFGHTGSALMFGHNGAGGQLAWADPESGISLGYCTNGFDRNHVRLGRRGVGIGSRAAGCALDA